jgi:hypothetical protein
VTAWTPNDQQALADTPATGPSKAAQEPGQGLSRAEATFVAGYLAARERVADGDAGRATDGQMWVPADLNDEARPTRLEAFHSRFEP